MRALLTPFVIALLSTGAMAQDLTPEGTWMDSYGTSFTMSLCGDGTQLCAILNDIQGESRTEQSLAYVGKQVMMADQTAPNEWEGEVNLDGTEAKSTVKQVDANTIELTGCRLIICNTLTFNRV